MLAFQLFIICFFLYFFQFFNFLLHMRLSLFQIRFQFLNRFVFILNYFLILLNFFVGGLLFFCYCRLKFVETFLPKFLLIIKCVLFLPQFLQLIFQRFNPCFLNEHLLGDTVFVALLFPLLLVKLSWELVHLLLVVFVLTGVRFCFAFLFHVFHFLLDLCNLGVPGVLHEFVQILTNFIGWLFYRTQNLRFFI